MLLLLLLLLGTLLLTQLVTKQVMKWIKTKCIAINTIILRDVIQCSLADKALPTFGSIYAHTRLSYFSLQATVYIAHYSVLRGSVT